MRTDIGSVRGPPVGFNENCCPQDMPIALFFELWELRPCSQKKEEFMAIDPHLLELLVCPKCKGDIRPTPQQDGLICDACRLIYEIRDDIPIMLIEEAKPLG